MEEKFERRIDALVAFPHELVAYRKWLAAHDMTGPRDYLFAEKRTRFEPRREDVVVPVGELSVTDMKGKTIVRCADRAITIPIPDVPAPEAERMLAAVDGERCLLEVQLDSGLAPIVLARMLRATFGRVLLAPHAVSSLESRISGLSITRFPGLPYSVMRGYWANMADVRERIPNEIPTGDAFVAMLRRMHVVALMGARLDSFYKPASPGADDLVAPGALFHDDVRLVEATGERDAVFLSGPRVNAKLIGGDAYHTAMYRSVGDASALSRSEELTLDGLPWGRVVVARSEKDTEAGPWFCPPRPITDEHFAALERHLRAACDASTLDEAVAAGARFHWCFVRLHPFHNANQSLAMNLVNAAIEGKGGAGIPHLVLDHFALRLKADAFAKVVARAVAAYGKPDAPVARVGALIDGNAASYRFIDALTKAGPDAPLSDVVASDPEGAAFALLA